MDGAVHRAAAPQRFVGGVDDGVDGDGGDIAGEGPDLRRVFQA